MKNTDTYFFLELALTFVLLICATVLLSGVLGLFQYLFLAGLGIAFFVGWLSRQQEERLIKSVAGAGSLIVFVWTVYCVFNSSFFYKEVLAIWIRGVLLLELVLGLAAALPAYLTYVQLLSVPLYMSWPVFADALGAFSILAALGYVLCWFYLLKLKFYETLGLAERKNFQTPHYLFSPVLLLALTLAVSLGLWSSFLPERLKGKGIFLEADSGWQPGLGVADEDFYLLQSQMQGAVLGLLPQLEDPKNQYQANALLGLLVKESVTIQEVEKAENGLVSILRTPGLGIEKDKGRQAEVLLRKYVRQKSVLLAQRNKDDATDAVKKAPFKMRDKMSVLFSLNQLQEGNSYKEIRKADADIKSKVDAAALRAEDSQPLQDALDKYKEWKSFQVYRHKMEAADSQIKALEPAQQQALEEIASAIPQLQTSVDFKKIASKLQEAKESQDAKTRQSGVVDGLEDALLLRAELFVAQEAKEAAQAAAQAASPAAAPAAPPEELQKQQDEARALSEELRSREKEEEAANARLRQEQEQALAEGRLGRNRRIADAVAFALAAVFVLTGALFAVFYFLRQHQARKLKRFFASDQRQFIIGIYENARAVLTIMGAGPWRQIPPLSYADSIQARYTPTSGIFRKFTEKFEEAKYSQHVLLPEDARLVLGYYNDFLRILLKKQGAFSLFLITYPRAILERRPFFIRA
ncbi:MAG TPA: hypothetical protein VMD52_06010 [Patescibacteria group bacterium]|nr:hypothetical protein [Patescibacteria group bacterium]